MAALPRWGVVATVQAPADQVLAFAAHHLDLGAQRVWLHFDDPEDPAADRLTGQKGITVIRCDAAYWAELRGERPATHQERQVKNATRIARRARLDWIAHIDVDEFLVTQSSVAKVLAAVPPETLVLRVEPWEALYDPALPPDIFTAQLFRRQIPRAMPELAQALYGVWGPALDRGLLSHSVGKCFVRTGRADMVVRIHGARLRGEPVPGGAFDPDLALLHFHAQDPVAWKARLPFRLARGAYRAKPALQAALQAAGPDGIDAFYDMVQLARPELVAALQAHGMIRQASLGLCDKVAARFADAAKQFTSSGSADPA